jgi:hypothetical protein
MKTQSAFVVEKKVNSLRSSVVSKKRWFQIVLSFTALSFLQKTSLIFIHSAQAAFTHTLQVRARIIVFFSLCSRSRE